MTFRGAALIVCALDVWHAKSKKPGDPELDNCPSYVTEGSNLTCRCRPCSCKPGTPRPVVTWTPKQAGDNQLHISNIQRESDKQTFTCYQYWGGWNDSDVRTVSYTVYVYSDEKDDGPTAIVIASGLKGGLAVVLIIVKRRRGSEGNTAPRTVGPATSADEYLEPQPRRPQSAGLPRRPTGIWNYTKATGVCKRIPRASDGRRRSRGPSTLNSGPGTAVGPPGLVCRPLGGLGSSCAGNKGGCGQSACRGREDSSMDIFVTGTIYCRQHLLSPSDTSFEAESKIGLNDSVM